MFPFSIHLWYLRVWLTKRSVLKLGQQNAVPPVRPSGKDTKE
jgi:hypothetical protein